MKTSRKIRKNQRGVALLMAMLALLLLSAVGLGMMYAANTETAVNSNYAGSMRAYYAALGGIEEVRDRVRTNATTITAPLTTPSSTGGTIYVVNPYVLNGANVTPQPWAAGDPFFDTEYCHEVDNANNTGLGVACAATPWTNGTWYGYYNGVGTYVGTNWHNGGSVASASPNTGTANALDFRWTRINMKTNFSTYPNCVNTGGITCDSGLATSTQQNTAVCWTGSKEMLATGPITDCTGTVVPVTLAPTKPVYLVTSLAVAPNGSRRMMQMEIADNPPLITNAAVDTNDFVTVSGSSVTVNGYDNCKCSCINPPGGGAPNCTLRTNPLVACTGSTYSIYSSSTVTTSGNPSLVAGTSPPVAQNQTFPYNIPQLITKYANLPGTVNTTGAPYNISCSTGSPYPNCGTMSSGTLGTLPTPWPPVDPTNPIGAVNQVTYVPGSFDIQSHTSGSGVLIVNGDLTIHGGLEFYGLIIVRGVLTFSGSGTGQNYNVIGSVLAGNGSVADTLQGGINIQFDRCALLNTYQPQAWQVITARELAY